MTAPAAARRSRLPVLLAASLALLLGGCVYFRLMQVQNQLKRFDEFILLHGRPELVIRFKKPALTSKDARFLVGADPLRKVYDGDKRDWHYEFDMARSGPPEAMPLERLSLVLRMESGRLSEIVVPETFMLLFPRNVMIETMRAAASAEVSKLQKIARARIRFTPHTDAELPSRAKVLALMGSPLQTARDEEGREVLTYRYRITGDAKNVQIVGSLAFSDDGLLRRVFIRWDSSAVDAVFLRDDDGPPPSPAP
jgi:hypothetical protein